MLAPFQQVRSPESSTVSALSAVPTGGAPTHAMCSKEGSIIMPEQQVTVVGGVDTHRDNHVAATIDSLGRLSGVATFPATGAGYGQLLGWMRSWGDLERVGIEGTGSYGAGLARHLAAEGVAVVEVIRPNRQARRRRGKSDPADAEAAARAVLCGEATVRPKSADGPVEAIRFLCTPHGAQLSRPAPAPSTSSKDTS